MSTLAVLLFGFLLGIKHASETDHVAAVATLVSRAMTLAQTLRQGVLWGIGHTLTLTLIGVIVLLLGRSLPARLSSTLELAVGVMLVLLGLDVLRRMRSRLPVRAQPHSHLRPLAVGMMHGMAGSAALIVLALGSVPSWRLGLLYIAVFGFGSIVGMALLSVVMAMPLQLTARLVQPWHKALTALVGVCSCGLGAVVIYRIGFVEGLLR
jgi:hypothetical protein